MSGFRQSQALLHSWSGLIVGWVLYAIFLTGTIAFWRADLNRWMRPELGAAMSTEASAAGAVAFLMKVAPEAKSWSIYPTADGAQVYWQPRSDGGPERRGRRGTQALVGADGQRLHARETKGGEFFYRFHFDLYYVPVMWSRWFVGFCAMLMFVAIISGVITHKKIFRDFFTFRRRKGQRTWLDGHNALAVLVLPFHLMITYTGLVTFLTLYMPWGGLANFGSERAYRDALSPSAPLVERSEVAAPLAPLAPLMRDARARWDGREVGTIRIEYPGDAASRVTVSPGDAGSISTRHPAITYAGATGRMVWKNDGPTGAVQVYGVMVGLHAARFAPDLLRWLYFLSGVAGTVMVAGGLVMWTVKRREKLRHPQRPHLGFRIVERLNIGFVAGLPLGIAAFLWANRLLPVGLARRDEWEIHTMFAVWGAALLVVTIRPGRSAWATLLGLCGGLLAALPLYDLAGDRSIVRSLAASDLRMATASVVVAVTGCAFLLVSRCVAAHDPGSRKRPARRSTTASVLAGPAE
jgi:uncharacterized iron-regulated membrane protein